MMKIAYDSDMLCIVNCGLSENSRTRMLARVALKHLKAHEEVDWIDLQEHPLPMCNGLGQSAYAHPNVKHVHDRILASKGVVLATPIYNWDVSASSKNLLELVGKKQEGLFSGDALRNKVVAHIAACGTDRSYLAAQHFGVSLLSDFGCTLVPKPLIASFTDLDAEGNLSDSLNKRLKELMDRFVFFCTQLSQA